MASGGRAETKAAYRRLANPALAWRELLEVHMSRTREQMIGHPVVQCLQARTKLDFSARPGIGTGAGQLTQHGRYMHPTRVVPRRERR